ncbi:unnamed protein product, partial [Ectocarpus sp. 12 AP-2014]
PQSRHPRVASQSLVSTSSTRASMPPLPTNRSRHVLRPIFAPPPPMTSPTSTPPQPATKSPLASPPTPNASGWYTSQSPSLFPSPPPPAVAAVAGSRPATPFMPGLISVALSVIPPPPVNAAIAARRTAVATELLSSCPDA